MLHRRLRTRVVTALLVSSLALTPAHADDATTKTGIIAGLGINAAKGQTTLGSGAGVIEAATLNTTSFQAAAAQIVSAIAVPITGRPVLVVTKDQTVDLATPLLVRDRLQDYTDELSDAQMDCGNDIKAQQKQADQQAGAVGRIRDLKFRFDSSALSSIVPSDFAQALMTDISINPITLSADDRMLVNALLMTPAGVKFRVAGEAVAMPTAGTIYKSFRVLVKRIDAKLPICVSKEHSAKVAAAQTFITSLTSADKGAISALATAIQYEPFTPDPNIPVATPSTSPVLLRVAIEQDGGTAITRQNIFYELGLLRGAATVSAGLIVSYRLIDPQTGGSLKTGVIWCLRNQVNLRRVKGYVPAQNGETVCTPVASAPVVPAG